MYARQVVPILLIAGGLMMFMRHKRLELLGEAGEQHHPMGSHSPRGEWGKRVPPLFELWHKQAHEQEAQQPAI